jgi:alanine-glyoxylate transaminase/serine-glyoxylate transaminase/serine-pyruvate transaminase
VQSLRAALAAILEEGLESVWDRHRRCGELLRSGLRQLGLELLVDDDHALPQLTSVKVPESIPNGMNEADVRMQLLEKWGIEIGGGLGPLAGKIWRIGCMGHTARERNVHALLGALEEILGGGK